MGDAAQLIKSFSDFGGLGVVIAFLIWWNVRCDKQRERVHEQYVGEKRTEDERRFAYDKERLATDKELAAALAALTSTIQSRGR